MIHSIAIALYRLADVRESGHSGFQVTSDSVIPTGISLARQFRICEENRWANVKEEGSTLLYNITPLGLAVLDLWLLRQKEKL